MANWIVRPCGVLIRDGQLLTMQYQYGGQRRLNLPGGNLEEGEEITTALAREFVEELALAVEVGALVGTLQTQAGGREVLHMLFQVHTNGEPRLNPAETKAEALAWVGPKALAEVSLYPAVPQDKLQPLLLGQGGERDHWGLVDQPWF
uniref:Putative NUDIX hydrolase n=1 Tax=Magnetococcus massalia (strain MO-1) TaxID=451514 RepID=A0A1S7LK43_MAGMO|nr:putative NUDIX hydrolase [Candidatus Magnetococcus massalia]